MRQKRNAGRARRGNGEAIFEIVLGEWALSIYEHEDEAEGGRRSSVALTRKVEGGRTETILECEGKTVEDLHQVFGEANHLVGYLGSGLTFEEWQVRRGCTVVEFAPERNGSDARPACC